MALPSTYTQVNGSIAELFKKIQQGQAPTTFSQQHLKDIGLLSSNARAFIPMLKSLGFLSSEGAPTARYHAYRDASQSERVLGDALKETYADLFVINASPTETDRKQIEGKFKSTHNTTDRMANMMAGTFFTLLGLADLTPGSKPSKPAGPTIAEPKAPVIEDSGSTESSRLVFPALNYNIQIHLPATKDVEVYSAIFKSLKEHLVD